MAAAEILSRLELLLTGPQNQALVQWELFWYGKAANAAEFGDDHKRETLPLRIGVTEAEFERIQTGFSVSISDDGDLVIPLGESGRQPDALLVTRKQQLLIPENATPAAEMLALENPGLKEALLLARLAARYPQLAIDAEFGQAEPEEIEALPQAFRRLIFRGIISGRRPSAGLRLLDRYGLLDVFLPEVTAGRGLSQNRFHAHDIFEHLLRSVDGALDLNEPVRWSALLHDIGKVPTRVEGPTGEASFHNHEMYSARMIVPIMKRLAVPIGVGQKVKFLVRNHMFHYTDEWSDKAVRRFVKKVPLEELQDLISLRLADRKGSGKKTAFPKALQKLIEHIDEIIAQEKEFKIKDLAVNGHTLMEMGVPASREMGDILKYLHEEVKAGRAANESEILVHLVRQRMQQATTEN